MGVRVGLAELGIVVGVPGNGDGFGVGKYDGLGDGFDVDGFGVGKYDGLGDGFDVS
jgi:hypothetical protein